MNFFKVRLPLFLPACQRQRRLVGLLRAMPRHALQGLAAGEYTTPHPDCFQLALCGPAAESGLGHGKELLHVEYGEQGFLTEVNHWMSRSPETENRSDTANGKLRAGHLATKARRGHNP